ncbi:MAG: hypothetical protein QG613_877 [Pseudomonadota bacterium]|nr:hypothetical protein [Pseudomonadota bacterium]
MAKVMHREEKESDAQPGGQRIRRWKVYGVISGRIAINIVIELLLANLLGVFLRVVKVEAKPLSDSVATRVGG